MFIFSRKWGGDSSYNKEISHAQFIKGKIFIWVYFIFWLSLGLYLLVNWFDLPKYISWPLAVLEAVIVPDLSMFKLLFQSYKSYKDETSA